jgi:hypothetical protein
MLRQQLQNLQENHRYDPFPLTNVVLYEINEHKE